MSGTANSHDFPQLGIWPEPSGELPMTDIWHEAANRLFLAEAFRQPPNPSKHKPNREPYSLDWFTEIESRRYSRQGHWIPRVLEFSRHAGETLLGLGEGLGTDWLQYARHGANVIACSPSQEQVELVRRNFALHELPGRFIYAPPHRLPLDSASVDVVCVQGLLHEMDRPDTAIAEVYRVLRPGGKVLAVLPAAHNAMHWRTVARFWRKSEPAVANGTTPRQLLQAFGQFADHKVSQRHIRRGDLPHVLRWLPLTALERVAGESLIVKAFKPVSVALGAAQAA